MRQVSDAFLLQIAEISGTLIGLFLIGVFFYVETGFRRLTPRAHAVVQPYFKAGTRIVLLLYALPLFLSLTLVVLGPVWNRVLFLAFSVMLVAANLDTIGRIRAFSKVSRSTGFVLNELLGTVFVLVLVALPWVLGGLHPSREDLTWAMLLSLGAGFLSAATLVLSVYDDAEYVTSDAIRG